MESCEKQVNTWRVVGGKRANSLKWDHTGGGEEEHSVIEAYKLQTAKLAWTNIQTNDQMRRQTKNTNVQTRFKVRSREKGGLNIGSQIPLTSPIHYNMMRTSLESLKKTATVVFLGSHFGRNLRFLPPATQISTKCLKRGEKKINEKETGGGRIRRRSQMETPFSKMRDEFILFTL